MIRGTATVLLLLTSLVLGHAPCCVVGKQCCDENVEVRVEESTCSCCKEDREPEPEPQKACDCDCDEIIAILTLGTAFEVDQAALPFAAWNADSAALPASAAPRTELGRAPPRPHAARTLPLLL
ncbi:MAG: hypothetical protein ACYS0E_14835 [Planctomycetota bacterium]|jgi:hypothetical protein